MFLKMSIKLWQTVKFLVEVKRMKIIWIFSFISGDKDSLEEQRDDVEEEIERLEEQVTHSTYTYFASDIIC